MPVSGKHNHLVSRLLSQECINRLRHGLIPQYLRLVEEIKGSIPKGFMFLKNLFQPFLVRCIRKIHPAGDIFLFFAGQGFEAAAGNFVHNFFGDIERHHRYVLRPGELENGSIEVEVKPPASEIFALLQKVSFIDLAGHVIIQDLLDRSLEHLHADGDLPSHPVQIFDDLQLHDMMRKAVMDLTYVDDFFGGYMIDHLGEALGLRRIYGDGFLDEVFRQAALAFGNLAKNISAMIKR